MRYRCWSLRFLACQAALLQVGCLAAVKETRTERSVVETQPAGATVTLGEGTTRKIIGQTPATVEENFEVVHVHPTAACWVVASIFPAAGLATAIIGLANDPTDLGVGQSMVVAGVTGLVVSSLVGYLGCALAQTDTTLDRKELLRASLDGYQTQTQELPVPGLPKELNLKLAPDTQRASELARTRHAGQVFAVFEVNDTRAQRSPAARRLTDYLEVKAAEVLGARVVPREDLKRALQEAKTASYKACVDESCQIELGKALSAQKTLSTKLLGFGNKCVLTVALYDLKTETVEQAASITTTCSDEALAKGIDQIVQQLAGG